MEPKWIKRKLIIKKLVKTLKSNPEITKFHVKYPYLTATFKATGLSEKWEIYPSDRTYNAFKLPINRCLFADNPQINDYRQFENNPLYPEDSKILEHHFIIKKDDLDNAGWCDTRIFIHQLANRLAQEGYVKLRYTDAILKKDWENLLNEDYGHYQSSITRFNAFRSIPPSGRRLIMHFIPSDVSHLWNSYHIYLALNKVMTNDITRESIIYNMSKSQETTRHPAFYRALLKQWLPIKGKKVLDLSPDWGFKSLAIWAEDGDYYCDHPYIDNLKKLADFLGKVVKSPSEDQYYLTILSDIYPVDLEQADQLIFKYRKLSENMMITINKNDRQYFIDKYNPSCVMRVKDQMAATSNSDNYIILIRQK